MPNWCYNNLRVEAEAAWTKDVKTHKKEQKKIEKELAKFKKENIKDKKLTFEGSAPRPKELDITSGSNVNNAIAFIKATLVKPAKDWTGIDTIMEYQWTSKECKFKKNDSIATKRRKVIDYLRNSLSDDDQKMGWQAIQNLKKYGFKDWYSWSIHNWGTKWDASDGGINSDHESELDVSFETAWAPPIEWLEKASIKYKKLKFTLEYTEEGMSFEGKSFAKGGEVVNNSMQIDYPDGFWD
jgi:hypothetical protein